MKRSVLALLPVLAGLSACGGGGGGDGSTPPATPPATPPPSPPTIYGNVLTLYTAQIVASSDYQTNASFSITDSTGAAITTAQVTVDGTAIAYNASDQNYEGALSITPGKAITVNVTVNGTTFTATGQNFSTFPSITSPVSGSSWGASSDNLVSWSGALPDDTAEYAVGIETTAGSLVWPASGGYDLVDSTLQATNNATVPAASVSAGDYYVLVGVLDTLGLPSAAAGSELVIGGFAYSKLTVTDVPTGSTLAISPDPVTLSPGKTLQLAGLLQASNEGSATDVTAQVSWSSGDTSTVTVSNTGTVSGVAPGTATVTASYEGITGTATVNVLALNPSPTPPLSQSVAYQIDYAHSGRATVGSAGPTLPPVSQWSTTLGGSHISYPVIAGGLIFVTTDLVPAGANTGTTVYALDETTGSIVWGPITMAAISRAASIAYDHGTLFVTGDYGVWTFDAATGTPGWSNDGVSTIQVDAPPVAVNGILYVNTAYGLMAFNETDGTQLWDTGVGSDIGAPAVSDDGVFVSLGCDAYKFDPVTALTLWHFSTGCSGGGGYAPVYAAGSLYTRGIYDVATGSAPGRTFNASTGAQTGTFAADAPPAFSDTTEFVLSQKTLTATALTGGATLWTFSGDGGLVSAPIVIDGVVVTASSSGTVYALDAASGSVRWQGTAGAAVAASDEEDPTILTGLGAGDGYLVVPSGNVLNAWRLIP